MWSGLVGIVSKYEEWGSSGHGRSDMCLVCLSYSIVCVQYGMCPLWGVSVWGVSVRGLSVWSTAVTGCRRTPGAARSGQLSTVFTLQSVLAGCERHYPGRHTQQVTAPGYH